MLLFYIPKENINMNQRTTSLLTCLLLMAAPLISYGENSDVLLRKGDVTVTVGDVYRFIEDTVPVERQNSALKEKGNMRKLAEDIYLTRTLAVDANKKGMDSEQLSWAIDFERSRRQATWMLKQFVEGRLAETDWDAVAKEAYLAEGDRYMAPEKVHASHVLLKVTDERDKEDRLSLLEEIKMKAKAGEDFKALAEEFSEDPTAKQNGGDLGFISRGQTIGEFEKTVFSMTEQGEISDIVETDFGFHIIQFHARQAPEKRAFEIVRNQIITQKQAILAKQAKGERISGVRFDPLLEWDEDALDTFTKEFQSISSNKSAAVE